MNFFPHLRVKKGKTFIKQGIVRYFMSHN